MTMPKFQNISMSIPTWVMGRFSSLSPARELVSTDPLDPDFEQQLLDRTVNIEMENLEATASADKILWPQLLQPVAGVHGNTKQSSLVDWSKNLQRIVLRCLAFYFDSAFSQRVWLTHRETR